MSGDTPRVGVDDVLADRAVETLHRYARERQTNPAWRATTLDRCIARALDGLILVGVGAVVLTVLLAMGVLSDSEGEATDDTPEQGPSSQLPDSLNWGPTMPSTRGLTVVAGFVGVLVAYELGMTAIAGATPGKRILGLRVVTRAEQTAPGRSRLALRTALWAAPVAFMLAMWFTSILFAWLALAALAWVTWPAFSRRGDGAPLYDRLAGTAVAKRRAGFD